MDWNQLFDVSIIKIRPSHMFFCWSFLFPERPIPDEINPLSRTQVPLLLLVYGVLSFHREVPKVKYSELTVFGGALTLVDFLPNSSLFRRNRCGQIKTTFSHVCDAVQIGSLSNDAGDLDEARVERPKSKGLD